MSKNTTQKAETKYFRYKFTPVLLLLCVLVLILGTAGIAVTVYRMIANGGILEFSDFLKYPFLIAVCAFLIALIVALLIKSQYVVTKESFITQFGFIKTTFVLKDITSITHDRDLHKLTISFGEQFCVIGCHAEWEDDFVHAILQRNPDIDYSYTLTDNKPNDNENK
jgi:hypothetical protein